MKWEEDLIRDIRYGNHLDDLDFNHGKYGEDIPYWDIHVRHPVTNKIQSISENNIKNIRENFLKIKEKCRCILEIGVSCNNDPNFCSTSTFLNEKKDETIYIGVDTESKKHLDNEEKNIFTIQTSSSNYQEIVNFIKSKDVEEIDFIFIDGWHSINQVMREWEFTNMLSDYGIVGFHDVTHHPGPNLFIRNLNREKWNVIENCELEQTGFAPNLQDYGTGFVWKKL